MTTMNVSLPESLKAFVDEQVEGRGYASSSEYVRDLIRREQDRERLLLEGRDSGPAEPLEPGFFDELRSLARNGEGPRD
jgi:antitoxin ParD1/3/4